MFRDIIPCNKTTEKKCIKVKALFLEIMYNMESKFRFHNTSSDTRFVLPVHAKKSFLTSLNSENVSKNKEKQITNSNLIVLANLPKVSISALT